MKRFMTFLMALIHVCLFMVCACPAEAGSRSVTILQTSLAYHGPAEFSYIVNEVRDGINRRLEARGYSIVPPEDHEPPAGLRDVKEAGKTAGVPLVLFGSVNLLGRWLSLDLRLMNLEQEDKGPELFFAQADRSEIGLLMDRIEAEIARTLASADTVAVIRIKGNRRIDSDAILQTINTRKGEQYDPVVLSEDIKAIYGMGFFEDVRIDVVEKPDGKRITYLVREKPAIRKINIAGNKEIKEDKIREVIDLKPFSVIQEKSLQENAEKIKALYVDKGFADTIVTASVKKQSEKAADITFEITEGEKVRIKSIEIAGNKAFSDDELEGLLETVEKKPFWTPSLRNIISLFKGDSAVLKWDALERDQARIAAFYHNRGYVDAKVGEPEVQREGAWLYVTIPVEEGEPYGVGKIEIIEDHFQDQDRLIRQMKIVKEPTFNQQVLRQDVMALKDMYADEGYAYADLVPRISRDTENRKVDIQLVVDTGPLVKFERIEIVGNTRTRDKVIRRELRVKELEPFSVSGMRRSRNRLNRLGYFEDVSLTPSKGSSEDMMNLKVEIKEQPTGTFSVGAGYSSVDKFMVMGEINQRNFLGKGQVLSFKGILGGKTTRFRLSFTEPYFLDTRFSLGVDAYNWEQEYDDYTKGSRGFVLRTAYPLSDNLRFFAGARLDRTDIFDVSPFASDIIRESMKIKSTHSIDAGLMYNSKNDFFNPTSGWDCLLAVEYAGFGGDATFAKVEGNAGYYHLLWREFVGHIHVGAGYVDQVGSGLLPVYERFFIGGLDTIRGFKYGKVSPIDPETMDRVGGNYMAFMQLETIFPLIKNMGLNGVVFFDIGNSWALEDEYIDLDLRKTVGFGIRWRSPMGPLRVEWGYNLDPQADEDNSAWEFRMGGVF